MFKSRKFVVWFITLMVFVSIITLELFLECEKLYIGELGIALTLLSGIYLGANVTQKKVLK